MISATYGGLAVPWIIGFPKAEYSNFLLSSLIVIDLVFLGRFAHVFYENQQMELAGKKFKTNMLVNTLFCFYNAIPFSLFYSKSDVFTLIGVLILSQSIFRLLVYLGSNTEKNILGEGASHKTNKTLKQMGTLMMVCYIVLHFIACTWISIANHNCGLDEDKCWFTHELIQISMDQANAASMYVNVIYLTTAMFMGGENINPITFWESVFCTFSLLVGLVFSAVFYGEVISMITMLNAKKKAFNDKFTTISKTMDEMKLPTILKQRVDQYFFYIWHLKGHFETERLTDFMNTLNVPLSQEVQIVCHKLVRDIPLFFGLSGNVIKDILNRLQEEIFLPGDYVFSYGDEADKLYIIVSGVLEMMNSAGKCVVKLSGSTPRRRRLTTSLRL